MEVFVLWRCFQQNSAFSYKIVMGIESAQLRMSDSEEENLGGECQRKWDALGCAKGGRFKYF